MGSGTRDAQQARNRERILDAAAEEFAEHGYARASVNRIAQRAGLTHGAVYSNFKGKRALVFEVLARRYDELPAPRPQPAREPSVAGVLQTMSAAYGGQIEASGESPRPPSTAFLEVLVEILGTEPLRSRYAAVVRLEGLLVARALERVRGGHVRLLDLAAAGMTVMSGESQVGMADPGGPFGRVPAAVFDAIAELPASPPWRPTGRPARVEQVDQPWFPPVVVDLIRDKPPVLHADGVVAFLGLDHLDRVEEVLRSVRAADAEAGLTIVLATNDTDQLAPLVTYMLRATGRLLRLAAPEAAWPDLGLVVDRDGELARATGIEPADDAEEVVLVQGGRIAARAQGRGAALGIAHLLAESRETEAS